MQENHSQKKRGRKRRRRSENSILTGSILLCIITLTAVTICLVMVFQYRAVQQKNTAVMSELEEIRLREAAAYSQDEVDALIDVYCHQCAISMNCVDLARSFLFLATGE